MTTAVAYIRVSTEEQHLGPAAQREAIERWAASRGVVVVAWHVDQGVSGGAPIDQRPELVAALQSVTTHRAALLVVSRRDRLARSAMIAAMVESLVARSKAKIASAAGEGSEGDENDPSALLMRRMVDVFAEYERALIRCRTKAGLAVKKRRGERVGNIPFGSRLAADGKSLEACPVETAAIARVRELSAQGVSLRGIVGRLEAEGVRPRGARWHLATVHDLVRQGAA